MGFESLLGNRRLKDNLTASLARGRISHFYLLSGPVGAGKKTLARLLAAAILCKEAQAPCGSCASCRKVFSGTHPDFITIDDPEKKYVPIDLIRDARADIYIQPNEADRKIYLFPRAQDMLPPAQNALLKVLEEPPAYGVFLLLTDNPDSLLPTIRSRCTELALNALPRDILEKQLQTQFPQADAEERSAAIIRSGGWLGQAQALLRAGCAPSQQTAGFAAAFGAREPMALLQVLVPMEKWKRDQLIGELQQWLQLLQSALVCRSGMPAISTLARELSARRSSKDLMEAVRHLQKAIEYAQGNVSPAAICGWLEWALR